MGWLLMEDQGVQAVVEGITLMSIAGILRRWVLVSAVTGVLALLLVPGVRAQAVSSSPAVSPAADGSIQPVQIPPNPNPNQPVPTAPSAGPLNSPAYGDTGAPGVAPGMAPEMAPGYVGVTAPGATVAPGPLIGAPAAEPSTGGPRETPLRSPTGLSALEVIRRSLFDEIYSPASQGKWSPLTLGEFFSQGWDVPYANPTAGGGGLAGTGGAPRQGWIGAYGATFFRAWFFAYVYAQGLNSHIGNTMVGQYTAFVPFNRRFELEVNYNFIVSNKGGASGTYHGNTGDTNFRALIMLSESKNCGQMLNLGFQAPFGKEENGGGAANFFPQYQIWWNFWDKWVLKGETGVAVPTNHAKTSGYSDFHNVLALGRYFPGSKESWFQQWWFYLVADAESTISGTPRRFTSFSLQPGMRCKMTDPISTNIGTGLWYFFAAVNVPMTFPQAISYEPIFAILYDY